MANQADREGVQPFAELRKICDDYKQDALDRVRSMGSGNGAGKHKRAAERRELETIAKTLNVVLAEIDRLAALQGSVASPQPLKVHFEAAERELGLRPDEGLKMFEEWPKVCALIEHVRSTVLAGSGATTPAPQWTCPNSKKSCADPHCVEHRGRYAIPLPSAGSGSAERSQEDQP